MPSRFRDNMVDGLNALNLLLPGVAVTYQGEEIGMKDGYVSWEDTKDVSACNQGNPDNYLEYSRDPARTPYHWDSSTSAGFSTNTSTWLPIAQDYREINLEAQKEAPRSHYKVGDGNEKELIEYDAVSLHQVENREITYKMLADLTLTKNKT